MMENNILKLLETLTAAPAVSGAEDGVVQILGDMLSGYGEVHTDALNNVTCTFGEGTHFLLEAHCDEVGMIVTEITDDGFIKLDACGGADARIMSAAEVCVYGKKVISGVICAMPPHLQTAEDEKKAVDFKDMAVDTGLTADELKELVSPGDRVIQKKNFTPLLNNMLSASCLDDRAGAAAIIMSLDRLKELPCKITVLFSTQEELGMRGAKIGPFGLDVDEAICVDVSFAYTPGCKKSDCGEIGKGAMIGFSPVLDRDISRELKAAALRRNIPYQCEIMSGRTGTDADVISVSQAGIKTGLISIPQKYMHQSVETVDLNDVKSVTDLICAYIGERAGDIKNA